MHNSHIDTHTLKSCEINTNARLQQKEARTSLNSVKLERKKLILIIFTDFKTKQKINKLTNITTSIYIIKENKRGEQSYFALFRRWLCISFA